MESLFQLAELVNPLSTHPQALESGLGIITIRKAWLHCVYGWVESVLLFCDFEDRQEKSHKRYIKLLLSPRPSLPRLREGSPCMFMI